ncbi:protein-tyrosine phosphatase [Candida albicans L26]|uniref:protein-tyrosine-phosphatase n=3 Tax=Candida albicans TaxID=5476 RepID=A0A1D8PU75_CANAL|nr:tyrosine protein phosphatase [Candida albicans SC5314]EEQ44034.1 hypothetical protein CAWG_02293 [Candida albicans WO-1]KGQ80579.1 protein-tyrosine phosphatase [Candida albicans P37005]KGR00714.1 protein-tyrosine phosphatase [Candida albicans P78048]KGR05366.1 protein-tyrosine phosphatase [Candida albicans P37037]KGT62942.1 protein-tyrosine phosphatase [Candida albicans 12C]KGU00452.1 protein-tyrosine phosphatase [Candida albicans L26]KGU00825.1 protein-tyrosine phosphatase [Candida albic|eukprot:XP_719371.1 tyrosine protein phosphatase [Candida albicans SC5314]
MTFTFPNNASNTQFKHHQQQQSNTPTSSNFTESALPTNNENAATATINKPTTSAVKKHQLKQKTCNNSLSSLNSNASDTTIFESPSQSTPFESKSSHKPDSLSTDTLVEDKLFSSLQRPPPPQAASQGQHSYNQSLDSHRSLNLLDEAEELEGEDTKDDKTAFKPSEPISATPKSALPLYNEHKAFPFPATTSTPGTPAAPALPSSTPPQKPSTNQPSPHLEKQKTSSLDESLKAIQQQQKKRINSIPSSNYRPKIEGLSDRFKYPRRIEMGAQAASSKNIVLDIRPSAQYSKAHIKDSINLCLPSTLLKRATFSFERSVDALGERQRDRFADFFNRISETSSGNLIVCDSTPNSCNLYHMCVKIANCPLFMSSPTRQVLLMDFELDELYALFPDLFESCGSAVATGSSSNSGSASAAGSSNSGISVNNYLPPLIIPGNDANNVHGNLGSNSLAEVSSPHNSAATPILSSNFALPSQTRTFKLRHNEELFNDDQLYSNPGTATTSCSNVNPFEYASAQLFKLNNIPSDHSKIPLWMKSTILDSNDAPVTTKINQDFHQLEKLEQKRLLEAFSLDRANSQQKQEGNSWNQGDGNKENASPTNVDINEGEIIPKISCGIEFGHKNRYMDIYLYDHSRVELGHVNKANDNDQVPVFENYINASLIEPPEKYSNNNNNQIKNRYIATQGPLDETMGDLWKMVVQFKIPLIVSLTDSIENGVTKCAPFWQSGIYKSYKDAIKVSLIEENKLDESLILRKFNVDCNSASSSSSNPGEYDCESQFDNSQGLEVYQIQLLSWADMWSLTNPQDILKIIKLKQSILANIQLARKNKDNSDNDDQLTTLVHCSAGCGRTGTFCVIDTIINYIEQKRAQQYGEMNDDFDSDPIFEITNHYRKLRISMVQTLTQYYMIYEALLDYYCKNGGNHE